MLPKDHGSLTCLVSVRDAAQKSRNQIQKLMSEFANEAMRLGRSEESFAIQFTAIFTEGSESEKRMHLLKERLESLGTNTAGVSLIGCTEGLKTVTARLSQ